jgi:hypothetical protein
VLYCCVQLELETMGGHERMIDLKGFYAGGKLQETVGRELLVTWCVLICWLFIS